MEQTKQIIILGIGGATMSRIETALQCGYNIAGLYHYNEDRVGDVVHGYPIVGSFQTLFAADIRGKNFLLTMGDCSIRRELSSIIKQRGGILPTLIHPKAEISRFANISSDGVFVDYNVNIQADVQIHQGVVICAGAMICHNTIIDPHSFIGPYAMVGARLHIKQSAFIGQKALLISSKATPVGDCSMVGAGALVTKSVEPYTVVAGLPAKVVKTIEH